MAEREKLNFQSVARASALFYVIELRRLEKKGEVVAEVKALKHWEDWRGMEAVCYEVAKKIAPELRRRVILSVLAANRDVIVYFKRGCLRAETLYNFNLLEGQD